MGLPKVSIVIPSYKPGHFEQCLRSAIGQTYLNTEILVSDNCPTEEIREICAKFPSVLYQRNSVVSTENVMSSLFGAKGVYIKPLFDDDLLHPFAVEKMVAVMEQQKDVELVFSRSAQINAANVRTEDRRPFQQSGMITGRDLIRMMTLNFRNYVGEFSTIMFRRDKLWKLGSRGMVSYGSKNFSVGLIDVAFYFSLVRDSSAYYIDDELSYFRYDLAAGSNSNPAANPDFGWVAADWIELLIEGVQQQFISNDEFFDAQHHVERFMHSFGVFPEVRQVEAKYRQLCSTLRSA
ncbi:MAG: glycosyltransferase [Burkholderiaceae bacterium]|nr:glycosyltransferase [Burkholderiaceae bacterium]